MGSVRRPLVVISSGLNAKGNWKWPDGLFEPLYIFTRLTWPSAKASTALLSEFAGLDGYSWHVPPPKGKTYSLCSLHSLRSPHALIVLRDQDDYDRYVAQYFPDDEAPTENAAAITPQDYTHVFLAERGERLDLRVLGNELSHNLLAHLPLPRWLMEGLSVVLTRRVTRERFAFDPDSGEEHRRIWNATTIQEFWSGHAFDSRLCRFAYSLADILVTLLAGQRRGADRFHYNRKLPGRR
jgi:hypothetical protein